MKTIKSVFAETSPNFVVNAALLKRIQMYEHQFTHRNSEHIEFFGGHLLGVEKVRFLPTDWSQLFDEVFELDDTELEKRLNALPSINKDHKVASDVLNLTCMWVAHKILMTRPTKELTKEMLYKGAFNTILIFQYKVLTSKMANDFPFKANKDLMTTVYATLNMKFSLKQHGSWSKLLQARAADVLSDNSIHYKALREGEDDEKFKYIVTDIQSRLRAIVVKLWETIVEVQQSNDLIATSASTIDTADGISVKEMDRHFPSYNNYIHSIVGEPTNFIKDSLIAIVANAMHTMSPIHLRTMLVYMSENYQTDKNNLIELVINDIMVHAVEFLRTRYKGSMSTPDLPLIITELRGMYMSARSTDPLLLQLRENIDRVIDRKIKHASTAAKASVRVGMALYVVLRALTKKSFTA